MATMILFIIAILFVGFKIYQKMSVGICKCEAFMTDKVVIVTGSNTGIGFETAKELAKRGAKVILACRDNAKGISARDEIIETTGNNNVVFKNLNLTSFKSVRAFADDIIKTEPEVHVLINNAGVGTLDNSLTEDNLPIEAQVNHFGPFLLTVLLLPVLKVSAPSRIVNVSSAMHWLGKVDVKTFHKPAENYFRHLRVYSNTKLANILFSNKLSRLLRDTGVTVNSLHPGAVSTEMFRNKYFFTRLLVKLVFKTPWEGAQTSVHLAIAPELENVSGKYFVDCVEAKVSKIAMDTYFAEKLWELSESVTKINT